MNRPRRTVCYCPHCSKSFPNEITLSRHNKLYHNNEIQESKATKKNVSEEKSTMKLVKDEFQNFKCTECTECFSSRVLYNVHLATHIDECSRECPSCLILFKTINELEEHLADHNFAPKHKCNVCSKTFYHVEGLNKHSLIHSGKKPYVCYRCNDKFDDKTSRSYHVAKIHLCWCSECEISFFNQELLMSHYIENHPFKLEELDDEINSKIEINEQAGSSNATSIENVLLNVFGDSSNNIPVLDVPLPLQMDFDSVVASSSILTNFSPDVPEFDDNSNQFSDYLSALVDQCRTIRYPLEGAFYMKILNVVAGITKGIVESKVKSEERHDYYVKNYDILSNVIDEHIKAVRKACVPPEKE